jgi:T5SS/PEP-CTERM-associated repeat protein/autotransporter-associated beta strand protein
MNRIHRPVRHRTSTPSSFLRPANARVRRRSPLSAALLVALGVSAASLPAAFAAVHEFSADETVNDARQYAEGFRINAAATIDVAGPGMITSGGAVTLGTAQSDHGSLRVAGAGPRLVVQGTQSMRVGDGGTGQFRMDGGAEATIWSLLAMGFKAGSTGTTEVNGDGTQLSVGWLQVGRAGNGALHIADGASVVTTRSYSGANNHGLSIGAEAGSTGIVSVGSRGTLKVTDNYLRVGEAGTGVLHINDGGLVVAERGVGVGTDADGNGSIMVNAGGQLKTAQLTLGGGTGSSGSLGISGTAALVEASKVWVGSRGDGTLRVEDGGVLRADTEVRAERYDGLGAGTLGQKGRIEVSGAGSAIEAPLVHTTNELLIEGGASIRSDTALIKDSYADGPAVATLSGAGSNWTNRGAMEIRGNVDVVDGATIETDTLAISSGLNSATLGVKLINEQVRVSGAGSSIRASNGLTVGAGVFEPYGMLSVANGGVLDGGTGFALGLSGYLVVGDGVDQWVASVGPSWRPAEAAGALSGSPIEMGAGAGGLVFNHTSNVELANTISSASWTAGAVTSVAGTTTLSGDLSAFGGDVNVAGGVLVINADMYTGQDHVHADLSPAQQINVSGGTLVLNGSSGFRQAFDDGNGSRVVRSSSVRVRDGGILAGNATVGRTEVSNGGVLSPGNGGVGTLTIDGDLFVNAGAKDAASVASKAFYDVDLLGNGQADFIAVTGKVHIGRGADIAGNHGDAGVRVTGLDPAVSYQQGHTYAILDAAGGIDGGFDDVSSNSAFITPTLTRTDTQVLLNIAVNSPDAAMDPAAGDVAPPAVFRAVAVTGNQRATAAALDSLTQSGEALALYNSLLMLDETAARVAFDELSGEVHASARALLLDDRFLRDGISQRLRPDPSMTPNGSSAWVATSGVAQRQDGNGDAAGTRNHRQGLMAGYDWTFGERWTVGVAGGPESLRQQIHERTATTEVDALHGGLYAGFRGDQAWLQAGATHADYAVETRRTLGAGSAWAQTLESRQDARAVSVFTEGGWDIELDALTLIPYLAVAYTRLSTEGTVETGGSAALAIAASRDEVWTTTAGMRAAWDISGGQQDGARLEAGLAWQTAAGELRADSRHAFVAGSDAFTVSGLPLARNMGIAELGVSVKPTDNSRLSMFAQGRAGGGQREAGAQLNWSVAF